MNFTGGNTLPNIGKRISWQVVSLAGSLAVAVGAVVGLGLLERGSQDAASTTLAPPVINADIPVAPQPATTSERATVYIVGSEEQADALRESMSIDQIAAVLNGTEPGPTSILVIDSPEAQQALNATMLEQMELAAPSVEYVDVRSNAGRGTTPGAQRAGDQRVTVYIVASQEQADAVRASVAAEQIEAVSQGQEVTMRNTSFVVVEPGDDEFLQNLGLGILDASSFDIVDAR